jgi:hypothetical protein
MTIPLHDGNSWIFDSFLMSGFPSHASRSANSIVPMSSRAEAA